MLSEVKVLNWRTEIDFNQVQVASTKALMFSGSTEKDEFAGKAGRVCFILKI